jgi:hypothetical protein
MGKAIEMKRTCVLDGLSNENVFDSHGVRW